MRSNVKKDIISILNTIEKANASIIRLIDSNDLNSLQAILESCQGAAITAGESIENSEGEGVDAVGHLEQYCEMLYQITLGNQVSLEELNGCIANCRSIVENLNECKEIVFLPYKASMWDSLESVWKKESKEENVKTYVIPIPYYDKNPDGTVREEHYEINDYPKDVPVMDYRAYDFEKRRPDKIYIHNPYDECNYVTTVHPKFYSKALRNLTDELIYIPYFVLAEPNPDDKNSLDSMEHFVTVPGVFNADKVIVQSENMRQAYINVLCDNVDEKVVPRSVWEKKIIGSGSPKFDKLLEEVDEAKIPDDWKKMIYRSDGSRRKIILYNTSVTALLQSGEAMNMKIKRAFQTFYENRENIVLLWRPHPLIKATIESMRPALWQEYSNIVEEYKTVGWGIYDDSPDMNRAIAISDAYYGDPSSLVELYKKMKKPIMIQNVDI